MNPLLERAVKRLEQAIDQHCYTHAGAVERWWEVRPENLSEIIMPLLPLLFTPTEGALQTASGLYVKHLDGNKYVADAFAAQLAAYQEEG